MVVILAASGVRIQANHVYVIPPNADLSIEHDTLKVISPSSKLGQQVDYLFSSLAESRGTHAVGIILSGYLQDGTKGCRHIKAKGGITFAQDMSAEVSSMPLSAQASGCIDFILPPEKMPGELIGLINNL